MNGSNTMLVNCIYAKDIGCVRCVECKLGLFGGAPNINTCNNHCTKRIGLDGSEAVEIKVRDVNVVEAPKIIEGGSLDVVDDTVDKFNTCTYRTTEEISIVRKSCCKTWEDKGYKCNLLDIFPLEANVCKACTSYKSKNV